MAPAMDPATTNQIESDQLAAQLSGFYVAHFGIIRRLELTDLRSDGIR